MVFMFSKENAYTPGGLTYDFGLTLTWQCSSFKNRPYDPLEDYTSPDEIIHCFDYDQSLYSQCLCGLYQSKLVVRIGSVFVYELLRIVLFIQKHWSLLCNDIRTGTINTQLIKDVSVREALKKILVKPDPELADFIEIECKRDESWKGIISRLWPNAKYIDAIVTGSMSQHIPSIDFYSNGLPLVSARYICSECFLGINLNPFCKPNEVAYTFLPNMAYFEFLPILNENQKKHNNNNQEEQHDAQELVELADVKLGHEYEVFVTTYSGLYRYGIGDEVRVVGFKNTAPQFQFLCRKKVVLSIECDKTTELELHNAVQNAIKHLMSKLEILLVDYTSYADTTSNNGHYVIYWELRHHNFNNINNNASVVIPRSVMEECCLKIEESLGSKYKEIRTQEKTIDPLEIKIVEPGTFDKFMEYAISQGSSYSQYKTPRCVKNVELLNSCVVSSYFSQEFPYYAGV
ncbi:hypothetical protein MKW92_051950 [Papaver armeniacum]|nr:hypothetical protein MKW92_051950 [Papaver armeniacum]